MERFGLGINRVDQFLISLGVEGTFPVIRPFVEYNLGIASNRQGYECNPNPRVANGDQCLSGADFSAMPSTLTLGLRAYPFLKGLEFLAAFDIGTTGTSVFIAELAGYPHRTCGSAPGSVDGQEIRLPPPQIVNGGGRAPATSALAAVHEDKPEGVANAIVTSRRDFTGLATGADGRLCRRGHPSNFALSITRRLQDGRCIVVVAAASTSPATAPSGPRQVPAGACGAPHPAPAASGWMPPASSAPRPPGSPVLPARRLRRRGRWCDLRRHRLPSGSPRTGSVSGTALDADTSTPVSGVAIRVVDTQGKELGIGADGNGAFHMEGLQPGTVTVKADADGYMLHVQTVDIRVKEDSKVELKLHKRPKNGDVEIAGNEIKTGRITSRSTRRKSASIRPGCSRRLLTRSFATPA